MGLLLYAITTTPAVEPAAALVRVESNDLTAWAADLGDDAPPFGREDLLQHHRVVSEVFRGVEACLPARFPTVFDDEDALSAELEARGAELTVQLHAVRGAAELAVTAVWVSPEDDPPKVDESQPGRGYLLRRQAALTASNRRRIEAESLAEHLEKAAGAALRSSERHVCPSAEVALSLALLVERSVADQVLHALQQHMRPGVRILVHGPWPPYTFAQRRDGGVET